MTKKDLIDAVCDRAEINKTEFEHGFNNLVEVIKEAVANGETIYLRGFGTFAPKTRKAKVARDISKDVAIEVPATVVPTFKASKAFKNQVSNK